MPKKILNEQAQHLGLAQLPPAMLEHAERVLTALQEKIHQQQALSFADFMRFALFEPGLGYYSAGAAKIGEEGDFITAPEISPLFSQALAHSLASVLPQDGGTILELGAGLGTLALELMSALKTRGVLLRSYQILEPSADLRGRQRAAFEQRAPELLPYVVWLDALPTDFDGVIIANEVLDAMPCERFQIQAYGLLQQAVGLDEEGLIQPFWRPADAALCTWYEQAKIADLGLANGYYSEVNVEQDGWLAALAACMRQGHIYLVDYGYHQSAYYHPQRNEGTLMCYFQHRQHDDPFILVGLQDITAHVNFSAIAESALRHGLSVRAYDNQANFLLNCQILDQLTQTSDMQTQVMHAQALKKLLLPGGMGEVFKVMVLAKDSDVAIAGTAINDSRSKL